MDLELIKQAVINDLTHRLSISADFEGWSWGCRSNTLEISLMLDGEAISTTDICTAPAGYKRDDD